jgi:hypothetical protein
VLDGSIRTDMRSTDAVKSVFPDRDDQSAFTTVRRDGVFCIYHTVLFSDQSTTRLSTDAMKSISPKGYEGMHLSNPH